MLLLKAMKKMNFCEACKFEKSYKLPFNLSVFHASKPLELVHTDLWGPFPVLSSNGYRYYIAFLDDYSRYTWIFPLTSKGNAFNVFDQTVQASS